MATVLPNNVFFTTKLVYEFSRYIPRPRFKNIGACSSCNLYGRLSSCIEDCWMDGNLSSASGILTPSARSLIWQAFWRLKAPSWRQGASLLWWLRKFVFKIMFALAEIHSRFMAHWWFCEYTWSYPFFPLVFRRASYMSDICKVWRSGEGQPIGQGFWDHHGTQIDGRSRCWPLIAFHMKLLALPMLRPVSVQCCDKRMKSPVFPSYCMQRLQHLSNLYLWNPQGSSIKVARFFPQLRSTPHVPPEPWPRQELHGPNHTLTQQSRSNLERFQREHGPVGWRRPGKSWTPEGGFGLG